MAAHATITAVSEGKKYKKGAGPRELAGKVGLEFSGIADVKLRLTRNDRGKCSTYDGKTEKFKALKKCGAARGVWFSVGAKQRVQLPAAVASSAAVATSSTWRSPTRPATPTKSLARGTSRVVFFVA